MKTLVWLRWLFVATCVGGVVFLGLRGSPYLAELPWLPRWLGKWADAHGVLRNVPAFAALHLIVLAGLGWGRRRLAVVGVCVFAAMLEFAQLPLKDRVFDWHDIVASWAGCGAAHVLATLVVAVRRRFAGR